MRYILPIFSIYLAYIQDRAMILTSGGIKGGTGKSTVAVNLAIMWASEGRDVLLIDADPQGTATDFTAVRNEVLDGEAGYASVSLAGKAVWRDGSKLSKKYDDVIIDMGGRDTASQRAALAIADILLVPFLPSAADVWTVEQVTGLIEEMTSANPKLRSFCFLNRAEHQGRNNEDAAELLRESEVITFIEQVLGDRKVFKNAFSDGLGVVEYKPQNRKAIREIEALSQYICDMPGI